MKKKMKISEEDIEKDTLVIKAAILEDRSDILAMKAEELRIAEIDEDIRRKLRAYDY